MSDHKAIPPDRITTILQEIFSLAEPRSAGTQNEENLKCYIENRLQKTGFLLYRQAFKFPRIPRLYNEQFINGLFVVAALMTMHTVPLIGFMLPIIFSVLPALMLEGAKLLPRQCKAENLTAVSKDSRMEDTRILIVAHMDTARTVPILKGVSGILINWCLRSFFMLSFLLALESFLELVKIPLPVFIVYFINTFAILISTVTICYQVWVAYFRPATFSPGANDNTSGVAIALTLAEAFFEGKADQGLPISFLFTSAEKEGLFGASTFINSRIEWVKKPVVINIDSIAGGNQLGVVTRYGRLFPFYTSRILNRIFQDTDHSLVDILHIHRCGDYLPFIKSGYQVTSIEAVRNGGTPLEYHTIEDTPDKLNYELVSQAYSILLESINKVSITSQGG